MTDAKSLGSREIKLQSVSFENQKLRSKARSKVYDNMRPGIIENENHDAWFEPMPDPVTFANQNRRSLTGSKIYNNMHPGMIENGNDDHTQLEASRAASSKDKKSRKAAKNLINFDKTRCTKYDGESDDKQVLSGIGFYRAKASARRQKERTKMIDNLRSITFENDIFTKQPTRESDAQPNKNHAKQLETDADKQALTAAYDCEDMKQSSFNDNAPMRRLGRASLKRNQQSRVEKHASGSHDGSGDMEKQHTLARLNKVSMNAGSNTDSVDRDDKEVISLSNDDKTSSPIDSADLDNQKFLVYNDDKTSSPIDSADLDNQKFLVYKIPIEDETDSPTDSDEEDASQFEVGFNSSDPFWQDAMMDKFSEILKDFGY